MKSNIKIIISVFLLSLTLLIILLTGAFGVPLSDVTSYQLIEDSNVTNVNFDDITYYQGDILVNIKSIDIGDNYLVLNYDMSEITEYSIIRGIQIFSDRRPLKYVTGRVTSRKGCAIAFEKPENYNNLEMHVSKIEKTEKKEIYYPLTFIDNVADFAIVLQGQTGTVKITLLDDTCMIESSDVDEYRQAQDYDLPIPSVEIYLIIGDKIDEGPFNAENPPEKMLIVYDEVEYSDEIIIYPLY